MREKGLEVVVTMRGIRRTKRRRLGYYLHYGTAIFIWCHPISTQRTMVLWRWGCRAREPKMDEIWMDDVGC